MYRKLALNQATRYMPFFAIIAISCFAPALSYELDEQFAKEWRSVRNIEDRGEKLCRYSRLMKEATERQLFALGTDAVRTAIELNSFEQANLIIERILSFSEKFTDDPTYGSTMHQVYTLKGQMYFQTGDVVSASRFLMKSIDVPPSPTLVSFGPSMPLARDLLIAGETEVVIKYLERSKPLWKVGAEIIEHWIDTINLGETPSFTPNVAY